MEEELEARAIRDLQEERSNLVSLRDHKGYKWLLELAAAQVKGREPALFTPLDSILDMPKSEFLKGEISGIRLFMQIVSIRIEILEEEIGRQLEELENAQSTNAS